MSLSITLPDAARAARLIEQKNWHTFPSMAKRGGAREGAGRRFGSKNKTTRERELKAQAEAQRLIDAARDGKIELAKDVLERAMKVAEGATSLHRPPPPQETMNLQAAENALAAQEHRKPRKLYLGDWPLFGEWFDRWVYAAKSLADFQSPKYKAIAVAMAPMNQNPQPQARTETNEPRDAQERERRAANDYLKLVKG